MISEQGRVMLNYVLMAVGFVFVIKGADFLVSSASSLARRVGYPIS